MSAFDVLDETSINPETKVKPFFKVQNSSDKEKLDWLNAIIAAFLLRNGNELIRENVTKKDSIKFKNS
jgi:hypothetical protein